MSLLKRDLERPAETELIEVIVEWMFLVSHYDTVNGM